MGQQKKDYSKLSDEELDEELDKCNKKTLKAIEKAFAFWGLPPKETRDAFNKASDHYKEVTQTGEDEEAYTRIFSDWTKLLIEREILIKVIERYQKMTQQSIENTDKALKKISERDERDKAAALKLFLDNFGKN